MDIVVSPGYKQITPIKEDDGVIILLRPKHFTKVTLSNGLTAIVHTADIINAKGLQFIDERNIIATCQPNVQIR